jgi:hypothetical protein
MKLNNGTEENREMHLASSWIRRAMSFFEMERRCVVL